MSPDNAMYMESVRDSVSRDAAFSREYVVMNGLATVVACYGLLSNSTAVVIGAMIIASLLGPITGIAMALVNGDNALLRRALLAEAGGVVLVLAISFGIGKAHQGIPLGNEIFSRTSPNILDLFVALAAGAAGAYVTASPRVTNGLIGVAIATALVPPLSSSAICLAHGEVQLAYGSFLLFLVNFVAIQLVSSFVLWLHGYHRVTAPEAGRQPLLRNVPSLALLALLAVVLGISFQRSLKSEQLQISVRDHVSRDISVHPGSFLASLRITKEDGKNIATAVVRTPVAFDPREVALIQSELPRTEPPVELHVRSVITKEATGEGWLHHTPAAITESP